MAYSNFYPRLAEMMKRASASFASLWHYYPSRIYLLAIVFFQGLAWWQAVWIKKNLSGELLVLRYKIDFGANLIGEPKLIFYYPLVSLAVAVIAAVLAAVFSRRRDFRVYFHLLLSSAAIFGFFMSLYLLSVFLINFR